MGDDTAACWLCGLEEPMDELEDIEECCECGSFVCKACGEWKNGEFICASCEGDQPEEEE